MSAASSGTGAKSIRLVSRDILDANTPNWHDPTVSGDAAHGANVKHYVYDDQNPRNFYVYPGVAGNSYIEIVYSANPSTVTQSGNLSVPDIYANAVMDYVLFRAYTKESEFAANANRAQTHYQLFVGTLTGKSQLDLVTSPNSTSGMMPTQQQMAV